MEDEFPLAESVDKDKDPLSDDHPEQRKNATRLQAIHHAFRTMEKKKRFHHVDAECLMRRQQASLDNLKSDNFALQQIVDTYIITDYGKQMAKLMYEANIYTGLIEKETKCVQNLEAMIHDFKLHKMDSKKKMGGCMAVWTKHITTQIHIQQNEDRIQKKLRKSRGKNLRTITKTHYAKRSRAGDDFRKWVEIKGFANVQDLMNVDSISDVLPLVTEAQTKNIGLFKHMQELVKEMDDLDLAKQEHLFDKPIPLPLESNVDSKMITIRSKKYEKDQMADHIVESMRHLMIEEEAFSPIVIDVRKQILLVFREAGCYIKDDEEVNTRSCDQAPMLTIGKLFSSLEDFVDRISGTFG